MGGCATTVDLGSAALCLGFANTWADRSDPGSDALGSYSALVGWAVAAGSIEPGTGRLLVAAATGHPDEATAVLAIARSLREAVRNLLSRLIAGNDPDDSDLATVNRALERTLPRLRLRADRACCRLEWAGPPGALDEMLGPVARAAAELLTSPDLARVRECASPDCGSLFLDTSRNRSRRWCDMASCGNRAKARRHYQRRRSGTG